MGEKMIDELTCLDEYYLQYDNYKQDDNIICCAIFRQLINYKEEKVVLNKDYLNLYYTQKYAFQYVLKIHHNHNPSFRNRLPYCFWFHQGRFEGTQGTSLFCQE